MRESNPGRRTLADVPLAFQKYVGHDNNRDFFLSSQAETINMNRVLYREWFPQIVYDHHQPAPEGTVMFAPPFRGPSNYVFDPLIPAGIDLLGGAMHTRFAAEGKRGVTMRSGSTYSTWWNGGLRTSAYFHNQIGLLTETIGSPTPTEIPRVPERQQAGIDLPFPISPQPWHFRQSTPRPDTATRCCSTRIGWGGMRLKPGAGIRGYRRRAGHRAIRIRPRARRAATSFRRTSPTFPPPRSSSTRC
jgi:hypothetical protein